MPRETFGKSTFELAVFLLRWLPIWLVDKLLLILAWISLGSIEKYGLKRPSMGPLELKNTRGKTPVLDIGALEKIRSGDIKVVPGIKRFSRGHVELVNGETHDIDSVVLATGYRSNVPYWLQVRICSYSSVRFYFHNLFFFKKKKRVNFTYFPSLKKLDTHNQKNVSLLSYFPDIF